MDITLSSSTLNAIVTQDSRTIWVTDDKGFLIWYSPEALTFLGLDVQVLHGTIHISEVPIYQKNVQFRSFADPDDPIEKIASIAVDTENVVCKKDRNSRDSHTIFSVISKKHILEQENEILQRTDQERVIPDKVVEVNDELSGQLQSTLAVMGNTIEADRAYIFQYNWDQESMSNTFEWCASEIEPEIDNLKGLPVSTFPWWQQQLEARKSIVINTFDDIPADAEEERTVLGMQGIQSVLVFPIIGKEQVLGFMGFDSVRQSRSWTEKEIEFLTMYSKLAASLFENSELIRQVQETAERNYRLFEAIQMPIVIVDEEGKVLDSNMIWKASFDRSDEGLERIHDYAPREFLHPVSHAFSSMVKQQVEALSGVPIALDAGSNGVRQIHLYGTSLNQYRHDRFLLILHDVTAQLQYQADIAKMNNSMSEVYLRFADAFCRLYDRFDFDWPDHDIVARLSVIIASGYGMEKRRITGLYIAALLHDIGKMMLPKQILLKTERLTEDERMLVRRHIVNGADVLSHVEFPWEVSRIIREQFEHADGSGYPNSLDSSAMLIESQILFMSNMFISLTESQNYREPYPVDQALAMMEEQSGRWYDEELFIVLKEFINDNLGRIRFIKRSLGDIEITEHLSFT